MSIGFTFSVCSFIYIFFLVLIFFSRKRLDTIENKIYGALIIANLFGAVLAILCYMTSFYYELFTPFVRMFVSKSFLIYYLAYMLIFTCYVYVVSRKVNYNNFQNKQKLEIGAGCFVFLLAMVLVIVLPLKFYRSETVFYSFGPSTDIVYGFSLLAIVSWIVLMIMNYKNLKNRKYLPIFVFIFLGLVAMAIQKYNPDLLLLISVETFITFLMYFMIENMDFRLIEQLDLAKVEAEKANQAKTEFLSNMSHEIRTPLNAIVGFSQALGEEELPTEAKEQLQDIISSSESLLDIVNGILDISKIEANKLEIVNTEYDFYKILKELVALTKIRIQNKPIEFRTHFSGDIPNILYGDHVRLKQIILNLLTNAAKYTNEGCIEFTVDAVQTGDICRFVISVADTGIGIKKENIDKLFTKFERCEIEKSSTIEGTGLGLAITKKLVEMMNGKIVVQSVYEQGSRFTVTIDQKIILKEAIQESVVETKDAVIHDMTDLSNKKVLIVDDNPMNLKVAARLLKNYQFHIDEVDSGFACIEKIQSGEHYDLILLDDMMPKMSGVETLKQLKNMSDGFTIPTIALTANAISGMREKYLADGFNDYLAKPINKEELNRVIQKFLT